MQPYDFGMQSIKTDGELEIVWENLSEILPVGVVAIGVYTGCRHIDCDALHLVLIECALSCRGILSCNINFYQLIA